MIMETLYMIYLVTLITPFPLAKGISNKDVLLTIIYFEMYRDNTLTLLSLLICSVLMFHQEDYETDLEYVKVAYVNPKYFQYYSLENVKPNRTYRAISGQTALLRDLGNTLKINIRGYKIVDNIPKVPIMQFDVLVCESFQKNILGLDVIRTKSTNITKCPIKKGFYFVQNFNVLAQHLPPFIPQGHYMLNLSLFEEKSLMAQVVAYGSVIYKNV